MANKKQLKIEAMSLLAKHIIVPLELANLSHIENQDDKEVVIGMFEALKDKIVDRLAHPVQVYHERQEELAKKAAKAAVKQAIKDEKAKKRQDAKDAKAAKREAERAEAAAIAAADKQALKENKAAVIKAKKDAVIQRKLDVLVAKALKKSEKEMAKAALNSTSV